MKKSRSVNFENFPFAPTIGAPTGVTIYVETQSLPRNGSHQKWLHEALNIDLSVSVLHFLADVLPSSFACVNDLQNQGPLLNLCNFNRLLFALIFL